MGIITEIFADKIIEPVDAMRSDFDSDKIIELSESIKKQGLINPITVRPAGDKFEIVAGHRRFMACVRIGVYKIPCVIREITDAEVFALRAHENLFREDVNPVDEALYIGKLVGEDESKVVSVADQLNRSVAWVEDRLAILTYPDYFLPSLKAGKIKLGVAKALAQIEDEMYRKMFFENAVRDGMTVWQAEYFLAQFKAGVFKPGVELSPADLNVENREPVIIKQICAKCGKMAIAPNLESVFVHVECPPDSAS